ncbi:hypothetical protein V2G26_004616 [Clonostachys chloroleuca]|uniref:Rhodopsin domain-containing protein n=1 Tax=Clonostachys chloroleuca TaxID=1926264 RepID=A0AA35QDA8_9HYPO|nr:unnamed protein product [Clonostachys chloroleuca]
MSETAVVENAVTIVNAAIWPLAGIATLFFALRLYCRIARSRETGWDDYALAAGWVLLLAAGGTLATTTIEWNYFGTSLDSQSSATVPLLVSLTHTLHVLSLALAKTAFAATLLHYSSRAEKVVVWTIIGSINALFVFHVFAQWKSVCGDESQAYRLPGDCWVVRNPGIVNIVSSMYSAATDFLLAFLPWRVFRRLQMNKTERIVVGVSMTFALIAGVTGILKGIQSIKTLDRSDPQLMWNLLLFWIFALAEPSATIIAASIPSFRVLDNATGSDFRISRSPAAFLADIEQGQKRSKPRAEEPVEHLLEDSDSDNRSILTTHRNNDGRRTRAVTTAGGGITLKTEVSIEFNRNSGRTFKKKGEAYEMQPGVQRSNSIKVKGKEQVLPYTPGKGTFNE